MKDDIVILSDKNVKKKQNVTGLFIRKNTMAENVPEPEFGLR